MASVRNIKNDYHTFGMDMPGRNYTLKDYRYGMNGQEKDNEVFSGGYSAMFWQYDVRLGRRWNLDPEWDESESPYVTFKNSPIFFNDPEGDCPWCLGLAIIEGGAEFLGQLASGKTLDQIDWADVGLAAVEGAIDGSGLGVISKIVVKGTIAITKAAVDINYSAKDNNNKHLTEENNLQKPNRPPTFVVPPSPPKLSVATVRNGKSDNDVVTDLAVDFLVGKLFDKMGGNVTKKYLKESILKKVNADKVFANATKKAFKEYATSGQKNLALSASKKIAMSRLNRRTASISYGIVKTTQSAVNTKTSDAVKAKKTREVGVIRSPKF